MGHELAHVTQKHGVKKLESTIAVQTAGEIVLGDGAGQQTASAIWAFFQNTTFSREDETEADLVGLQITKEGGYDPFGLANFFQKLVGGAQVPEFLSSHPASKKRVAAVRKSIRKRYGRKSKRGQLGSTKCKTPLKLGKFKKMIRTNDISQSNLYCEPSRSRLGFRINAFVRLGTCGLECTNRRHVCCFSSRDKCT